MVHIKKSFSKYLKTPNPTNEKTNKKKRKPKESLERNNDA